MKTLTKLILTVCNSTAATFVEGINVAYGAWNELTLGEGEKEWRGTFTRYGEYPVAIIENGRPKNVIQVVDREAAEAMAANFRSVREQVMTLGKGLPIFEGHSDDPSWRKMNPGYKPAAVGRIKEVKAGADGIETLEVFNAKGVAMLSGEAPEYSGHSPRWRMKEIAGRPGYYRPYLLLSDALTNDPNIPDSGIGLNESQSDEANASDEAETTKANNENMNEELLKRLGLKPGATQSEIDAAVAKLLEAHDKARSEKATAESNMTAANTKADGLQTKLDELQGTAVTTALNEAVKAGRITEAEKPTWEKLLKADFESGSTALNTKNVTALNTTNQIGDQGTRQGEGSPAEPGIEAMNTAAREYAASNSIDITNEAGWSRAWEGAKKAKPEVFAAKVG